jgi:protein-L-isoaspartate(D-aspartate) O-methyltransferase
MRGSPRIRRRYCQHLLLLPVALTGMLYPALALPAAGDDYAPARQRMVRTVAAEGIDNVATLTAMRTVPRHLFVPARRRTHAYSNRPLPIGYGQTISAPDIVGLMTQILKLKPSDRVLEVGTGSGYQAAVLSQLVEKVFTIEIVEPLGKQAKERFSQLGYTNITTRVGDGYYGWTEEQPFDAIIVTAAASHIPPPLIEQLRKGGRMIIPVGAIMQIQHLLLIEKDLQGKVTQRSILPVRFVPLTGGPRSQP